MNKAREEGASCARRDRDPLLPPSTTSNEGEGGETGQQGNSTGPMSPLPLSPLLCVVCADVRSTCCSGAKGGGGRSSRRLPLSQALSTIRLKAGVW